MEDIVSESIDPGVQGVYIRGVIGVETCGEPKSLVCDDVTLPVSVSSSLFIYSI